MLKLFVIEAESGDCIPTYVSSAEQKDFEGTALWQTIWTTSYAQSLPNKVALRRTDNHELLGLMSYSIDETALAGEIVYVESAWHSNANLLHTMKHSKKYFGIAKALFAYAADISCSNGFDGVLFFMAKTSELVEYYVQEFGARHIGSYDPFRLVIWEEAAERLMQSFERE